MTLHDLTPQPLWQIFSDICKIPRPSHHETLITQTIQKWAKEHNIACEIDAVGNLLLKKPATAGYENRKTVVLQAHLDMVPQKRDNKVHDFTKDPIIPQIKDGWVTATDTTLGADNGIGMASALALLFDKTTEHGPLEVLLTASEETGMVGAFGLQPNWLTADIMINTDAEEEGEIFVGCAGGTDVLMHLPIKRVDVTRNKNFYEISVHGLKGGHSGIDIHKGLGNANKLLAQLLAKIACQFELDIAHIEGGTLRNAIPRKAIAIVALKPETVGAIEKLIADELNEMHSIYHAKEPGLSMSIQTASLNNTNTQVLDFESMTTLINLLNAHPNGVSRMSDAAIGVTETSLNLGVIEAHETQITIISLVRSLIDSGKVFLVNELKSLASIAGAEFTCQNDYPGWAPDVSSPMLQIAKQTYESLYGTELKTMIIHAGLECGLLKKPYPNLDVISIGPTIKRAHSPDECVEIASVEKYWNLLTHILKDIPVK
ncbi:aminoacyl-histidine dipeptidase [Thorsellia anophelis]|uniref:Cytosol non-specific dipeptidase n=1 Tax=Thorsellia anophelis DSM 18579 TaxID=1123402 RepID=A0A1I0C8J1_9GAMM|nr:aminoacyl-histidine dipeptidase [Thorsellia anophelis]SET15795.1 dipeptidase D [Thorsellia anophelis DSM 18579]